MIKIFIRPHTFYGHNILTRKESIFDESRRLKELGPIAKPTINRISDTNDILNKI